MAARIFWARGMPPRSTGHSGRDRWPSALRVPTSRRSTSAKEVACRHVPKEGSNRPISRTENMTTCANAYTTSEPLKASRGGQILPRHVLRRNTARSSLRLDAAIVRVRPTYEKPLVMVLQHTILLDA
eukprot:9487348-Pyramimonas_sp.AAC.1